MSVWLQGNIERKGNERREARAESNSVALARLARVRSSLTRISLLLRERSYIFPFSHSASFPSLFESKRQPSPLSLDVLGGPSSPPISLSRSAGYYCLCSREEQISRSHTHTHTLCSFSEISFTTVPSCYLGKKKYFPLPRPFVMLKI